MIKGINIFLHGCSDHQDQLFCLFELKNIYDVKLKKNSGLQRDSNPWPPRYWCDALPTEPWSTHWEWGQFIEFISSREEWNDVKFIWNNSYKLYSNVIYWHRTYGWCCFYCFKAIGLPFRVRERKNFVRFSMLKKKTVLTVLYLQIFNTQNYMYILYKISASGLLLKHS